MTSLKRILSLVLVMAMTFSMLPVFAGADDAVSEVAAVEAAEAPTAEAPAAEVPAVEDVAELPAELPAAVSVVEAIETVATETVATLQETLSADDTAAVAEGKIFKIVAPDDTVTYVNSLSTALTTACAWTTTGGSVTMLADYVYLSADSSAASSGIFNWKYSPTYQTTDADGLTVNGFWLDLGGNTLTARRGGPMISASVSSTYPAPWVNIRNGHVIHLNLLKDGSGGRGAVVNGTINYGTTSTAPASADAVYQTHTTLKDVDIVTVDYSGSTSKVMKGYATSIWNNTLKLYDAKILTHNSYGVHFYKSTNTVSDADAKAKIREHGSNYTLELHGNSVVGNYSNESYAVFYGANKGSLRDGVAHNVTVTADEGSMFIGGTLFGQTDQSAYAETEKYSVNVTLPAGHVGNASFRYAVPSKSDLPKATGYGEAAYYDRGSEKEYAAMRYCSGKTVEHVAAKPATFAEEGYVEHWRCADCGACFTDETLTNFVEPEKIAVPKRAATDTEGLVTDEDFAKLGAVAIAVDPDGNKTVYTGSDAINDAYKYAATWEKAGGVVRLVCDYTYVNGKNESYTAPFLNEGANSMSEKSHGYANADAADERYAGLDLKGFWLDLGGHTLTMRTGQSVFYTRYGVPINIRNGRIIYQDTAKATTSYAPLKLGHTVSGGPGYDSVQAYCPEVTFDNLTVIRAPYYRGTEIEKNGPSTGPLFYITMLQSKINLIDTKLINDDASPVINYSKSMDSSAPDAVKATPYRHEVNIRGNCVIGRTGEGMILTTGSYSGNGVEGDGVFVNVADGADVTWLGTTIATIADAGLAACSKIPTGYVASAQPYLYTMPDMDSAAIVSSAAGVEDLAAAGAYTKLEKVSDVASRATFTPKDGTESEEMSLSAAFGAWEQNGFSGKITLKGSLSAAESAVVTSVIGTGATYLRPYASGVSTAVSMTAMYTISSEANGKDLIFDLGGNTLALDSGFLAMDAALENFALTLRNGTVTSDAAAPVLVLKGAGNIFKLEKAKLENTNETASFPYTINDSRYANSYSILTGSELSAAHGAAIALVTTGANKTDASLFYHIKDCTLGGTVVDGYSPATISALTSLDDRIQRPAYGVILEGTAVNGTVENLNAYSFVAITAPEGEDTPAASVSFGDIAAISCANVSDAVMAAELLSRNTKYDARVTLLADAEVTESVPVGTAGLESVITLDLNGKALKGVGLIEANGGDGTKVTLNVVGTLGGDTAKMNLFAHAPALDYEEGNSYVIEKGRYFTKYSLNLEDTISINLYTDGENGNADSVHYVQDGVDYTAVAGELNEWVVTTLAARDMGKTIHAYAVKNEGAVTYIDFVKGVSVKGYAASDPGSTETDAAISEALNKTLDTMLVYGEYAKKYFAYDYTEISNMSSLIGKDAPAVDTTNLTHTERKVTGIPNRAEDSTLTECFWGTSAVLESSIGIKFYFSGKMFDGVTAKVKYGNGDFVDAELVAQGTSDFKTLTVGLSAKDFDTEVTVKLLDAENNEIGTVIDSVEAYTSRVGENENSYRLAQALRAYGADAKRYYEAKYGN